MLLPANAGLALWHMDSVGTPAPSEADQVLPQDSKTRTTSKPAAGSENVYRVTGKQGSELNGN